MASVLARYRPTAPASENRPVRGDLDATEKLRAHIDMVRAHYGRLKPLVAAVVRVRVCSGWARRVPRSAAPDCML